MKVTDKFIFFWNGIYSNWYPCEFMVDGIQYNCMEQYMMYQKALLFNDDEVAQKILHTLTPKRQKELGRMVKDFKSHVWYDRCNDIVIRGCYNKFTQNPKLKDQILKTGDRYFVEASPYDTIWGIGMKEDDPNILHPSRWRGQNRLGVCLTETRRLIREGITL